MNGMSLPLRRTELNRETPFFFSCRQCLSCCSNKKIQVNPYEIARLAANRGLPTADFVARYTHDGGTLLNWEEDGTCVFLDAQGCSVHPDRPLVCRLYPLGRHVFLSGAESFSEIEPDRECKGAYGVDGRIVDYLNSQDARPFMEAADRYLNLFWRLYQVLERQAVEANKQDAIVNVFQKFATDDGAGDLGLIDVDAIVASYCNKAGIPFPKDINEKISIHIQAVEAWANHSRRIGKHETKKGRPIATTNSGKKPHKTGD